MVVWVFFRILGLFFWGWVGLGDIVLGGEEGGSLFWEVVGFLGIREFWFLVFFYLVFSFFYLVKEDENLLDIGVGSGSFRFCL